jgi:hypothetical protein
MYCKQNLASSVQESRLLIDGFSPLEWNDYDSAAVET